MESSFSYNSMGSPNPASSSIPHFTISPAETTLNLPDSSRSMASSASPPPPQSSASLRSSPADSLSPEPTSDEKKPAKKRKSWGQELPVPKTNLPPRKRAKTEDEKEQRRIERVLRNRAAAQTSRERKRLEVEKLENEKKKVEADNAVLLQRLAAMEQENMRLSQQVAHLSAEVQSSRGSSPPSSVTREQSPTLTSTLFKREHHEEQTTSSSALEKIPFATTEYSQHADGASLSAGFPGTSDLTQHPAEMLCGLQCQSEPSRSPAEQASPRPHSRDSLLQTIMTSIILVHFHLFQAMASTTYSSVIQPLAAIVHSLKEGCPLPTSITTPQEISARLPLILWLISTPSLPSLNNTSNNKQCPKSSSRTSPSTSPKTSAAPTKTTTTATTQNPTPTSPSQQRPVFRMRLLTRLLACSPALARPLLDATGRALQQAINRETSAAREIAAADGFGPMEKGSLLELFESLSMSMSSEAEPSSRLFDWKFLLTFMWAVKCVQRRQQRKELLKSRRSRQFSCDRRGRASSCLRRSNNTTTTTSTRSRKRAPRCVHRKRLSKSSHPRD